MASELGIKKRPQPLRLEQDETANTSAAYDKLNMTMSNGFSNSNYTSPRGFHANPVNPERTKIKASRQGSNVNLMTTGISSFGEQMSTTMMHARNALKIKKHNKQTMEARILKLNTEE